MELSTFLYEATEKSKDLLEKMKAKFPKENDRIEVISWQIWQQAIYTVLLLNYEGEKHDEIKSLMQLVCSYISFANPLISNYVVNEIIKPNEATVKKLKESLLEDVEKTIISTLDSLKSIIKSSAIVKNECDSIEEYIAEIKNKIVEQEGALKDQKKRIIYLRDKSMEILQKQVIEKSNVILEKHKYKLEKLKQIIENIDDLLKKLEICYTYSH